MTAKQRQTLLDLLKIASPSDWDKELEGEALDSMLNGGTYFAEYFDLAGENNLEVIAQQIKSNLKNDFAVLFNTSIGAKIENAEKADREVGLKQIEIKHRNEEIDDLRKQVSELEKFKKTLLYRLIEASFSDRFNEYEDAIQNMLYLYEIRERVEIKIECGYTLDEDEVKFVKSHLA